MRALILGWLVAFPLGCGVAVLSFSVRQTMSGRHLGTNFHPGTFALALVLFAATGWATRRYFRERATGRRPERPAVTMALARDQETDRRWALVSLAAWGLSTALLSLRSYMVWGSLDVTLVTPAALLFGGISTLIVVALPFRIFQNVIQPERRRARLRETVWCILALSSLVYLVISAIVSYPRGW